MVPLLFEKYFYIPLDKGVTEQAIGSGTLGMYSKAWSLRRYENKYFFRNIWLTNNK